MTPPKPLAVAATWHNLGYTPIPVTADGAKRPSINSWREHQDVHPDFATVVGFFAHTDTDGLGLLCGATSGNLEMLEAEGRAVEEGWLGRLEQAFADHGMADLWTRISTGYCEITPSGGVHWYYRVDPAMPVRGNTRLASRPATDAELAADPAKVKVMIETRGQGGFTVIAPSAGRTHKTGKPYEVRTGTPAGVPVLTADEYEAVHAIASTLDESPITAPAEYVTSARERQPGDPKRPGDDFIERASWDEILCPHGWVRAGTMGSTTTWRKPGKKGAGISATTGHASDADRLYVFSTSTEFEAERPYNKFMAYALLEHDGDASAAAKALREKGYGEEIDLSPINPLEGLIDPDTIQAATSQQSAPTPTDGNLAVVPEVRHLIDAGKAAEAFGPTEDGTARAMAHLHKHQLRFCAQRGRWLHWNGARWEWDLDDRHRQYVKELARALPQDDGWKSYKKRALSAAGTTGIARQAESEPDFAVHIDDLDANPYELNTPGGVVDLRTGTIRPPDPTTLHTRTTSVTPDFDRPGELFERFLATTFGGDATYVAYVQRLLGLSCIGTVLEQMLPFAHGSGANGKSTLIELAMSVIGQGETGYAIAAPAEMLMVRKHSEHPAELAQLAGARMVVCSELEDGSRFAEARIKQLTGGDSVSARFMRGNPFTFTPSHTIWLIGNHKPATTAGGPAFWRRLSLLPFEHQMAEGQRDKRLPEKLREESPAVLAWIVRGAVDYLQHGLGTPPQVTEATGEYAADQDSVGKFVEEQCHVAKGATIVQVGVSRLRDAYEAFCRETGDSPVSAKRLGQELRDRFGVGHGRTRDGRHYTGISLISEDDRDGWGS